MKCCDSLFKYLSKLTVSTMAIKSEPIKSLMGNKMLTYHIHFWPNEGMQEDKLKCLNFVAVTLKSSSPTLICYIYKQAVLSLAREQCSSVCSVMNPAVQVKERETSAKGMGINNSTQLESRNPLLRLAGIGTSENKDSPLKPTAVGKKDQLRIPQASQLKLQVYDWILQFSRFECQNTVLSSFKMPNEKLSSTEGFNDQIFLLKNVVHFIAEHSQAMEHFISEELTVFQLRVRAHWHSRMLWKRSTVIYYSLFPI